VPGAYPLIAPAWAMGYDCQGATMKLSISGMTCGHCAAHVERALKACAGVKAVVVDLKGGSATVTGTGVDEAKLRKSVEQAGYEVTAIVR
jgi:copper chaperone CopZ